MKKKLLAFLIILSCFSVFSQKIENVKRIDIDGFYTNPIVSPNGELVLLSGHHLKGVFILNISTNEIMEVSSKDGSGYGYSWDKNNDVVYFRQKNEKEYINQSKAYSFTISNKSISPLPDIDTNMLANFHGFEKNDTDSSILVYTNLSTLKIEAQDLISKKKWIITNDEGQFYNALISPNNKLVAVHKGSDVYIYPLEGSSEGIKIGTGLVTSWSSDSKSLIGFIDESEDGHSVSNAELLWFNIENKTVKKISFTEVFLEMYPSFIDSKTILFSEDKTGGIYIANLKM